MVRRSLAPLVLASALVSCGSNDRAVADPGGFADAGAGADGAPKTPSAAHDAGPVITNPFAGYWTCPFTTNSGFQGTATFDFTLNPDGTLSSTSPELASAACSLTWSVSGSTATVVAGTTCSGFTINSFTFTVSGDTASFMEGAVEHGTTPGADGGSVAVDISGSVTGMCTRTGAADAAAEAGGSDGSFYGITLTGPSCPGGQFGFIQETVPTFGTPECVKCFNQCQSMCQSMCLGYYQCACACDPHDGQCPMKCQAASSSYCQGCVTAGLDYSCFESNCGGSVCCHTSGMGCGTAVGYGCCNGTCTNGYCP